MDIRKLAQEALDRLAAGEFLNLAQATEVIAQQTLRTIAGTYTLEAERNLRRDILRTALALQEVNHERQS